jgi:hypothetical protein
MRHNVVIGFCSLAILAFAACSRSTVYTSKDGSVTVDKKDGKATSMTFTGKDGQKVEINENGGKMPSDYPKDVPVYDGAKVVMSTTVSEKNAKNIVLETQDPVEKIADFYKKGLESNGWKIEGTVATPQMTMYSGTKENRQAVIQIMDSSGKRSISQILSDK